MSNYLKRRINNKLDFMTKITNEQVESENNKSNTLGGSLKNENYETKIEKEIEDKPQLDLRIPKFKKKQNNVHKNNIVLVL